MTSRISPAVPSLEGIGARQDRTTATVVASFRFYEELNDFIARDRRRREFDFECATDATIKHVIEALGVPHTEVELILVNGVSVDFAQGLRQGDRISVYPKFEAFDISPLLRLRPGPLRITRFVADVHLGGLARLLRMAGFDTWYDSSLDDAEIERTERHYKASQRTIVVDCKTAQHDMLPRSAGCAGAIEKKTLVTPSAPPCRYYDAPPYRPARYPLRRAENSYRHAGAPNPARHRREWSSSSVQSCRPRATGARG